MPDEKRDAPESGVTLSIEQFLILWVTQLQMEITHQETDADKALFMVRGYDSSNQPPAEDDWFCEIDLYTDDPTNLVDGTWRTPQLWRPTAEEPLNVLHERATQRHLPKEVEKPVTANRPPIQVDVTDATAIIEKQGGSVTTFEISEDPWPHYEATIDGKTYGPMIETELYWFAYGVSLWKNSAA
jgi:hypothetical protein